MLSFKSIPEMLDNVENIALGDGMIEEKTGYSVVTYNSIIDSFVNGMKTIDSLVSSYGNAFIVLVEASEGVGHYMAIYFHSNGKLIVYDSYGMGLTKILKYSWKSVPNRFC